MEKFIVKVFKQSPFDMHEVGENALILCQMDGTPYAQISENYKFDDYVPKEGDIIEPDRIENAEWLNKKSKHLRVGDRIYFRITKGTFERFCGTLCEIKENKKDYWNDKFILINCTGKLKNKNITTTNIVLRKDAESIPWLHCEIKPLYKIIS